MEPTTSAAAESRPSRTPGDAAEDDAPRSLNAEERAAWRSVVEIMCALPRALDQQLQQDSDLTFFEYMVLSVLSEPEDRTMQMSEIAFGVSASLSRLSHVVAKLERRGMLRRARMPGPGRRTSATLTDAGHAAVVAAAPGHVATVRKLFMDATETDDLAMLSRIGDGVARRIDPGRPGIHDAPAE